MLNRKSLCVIIAFCGLMAIMAGCAPSIYQAVKVLYTVPIGASREDVYKTLGNAYTNEKSAVGYGGYFGPADVMTKQGIQDDKSRVENAKQYGFYERVYPTNLFDRLPDKVYCDGVIVREINEGGGFLSIYYDDNTNYIGFVGVASHKDGRGSP
jgi:hypothetical protein